VVRRVSNFSRRVFRALAPVIHSSPAAEWLVAQLLSSSREPERWDLAVTLRTIGKWLLSAGPPWVRESLVSQYFVPYFGFRSGLRESSLQFDADQTFAIFALLAVQLEALGDRAKEMMKELTNIQLPLITNITALLSARVENLAALPGLSVDDKIGLTTDQSEFVRRWVNRDFDLVEWR
jgi:hypothetical protein